MMDPDERKYLELTPRQQDVVELLRSIETKKFPLSQWYAGAIFVTKQTHNPDRFPQASHSLREILEKLYDVMHRAGADLIPHPDQISARQKKPKGREKIESTMRKVDPMQSALDVDARREKIDQYRDLQTAVQGFSHHSRKVNSESFMMRLTSFEDLILDLLSSRVAEDQKIIKETVDLPNPSAGARKKVIELIKRRGANFEYFFNTVSDPIWLDDLCASNVINNPAKIMPAGDGYITMPWWPPLTYLKKICNHDSQKIVKVICELEETDNPTVLREFFEIAADIDDPNVAVNLLPLIRQFINSQSQLRFGVGELIVKVFLKWGACAGRPHNAVFILLKEVIGFQPDPRADLNQAALGGRSEVLGTLVEAKPKIDEPDYEEILKEGVPVLAEQYPYRVAVILIHAIANMNKLEHKEEVMEEDVYEDFSESWCPKLYIQDSDYQTSKASLAQTLTHVCEGIYEKHPELVVDLDSALRKHKWKIFRRLRHYLYALHPSEKTIGWIREEIMKYDKFSSQIYRYEFQLMLRETCEAIGSDLLSKEKISEIIESILSGPSVGKYQKWVDHAGKDFTEESFLKWRAYFHHMQLRPFYALLDHERRNYYDSLQKFEHVEQLDDDSYLRFKFSTGGFSGDRSPKSVKDFIGLSDEEILNFINEWDDERKHETEMFVEISIPALAGTFGTFFEKSVLNDESRLAFWVSNYNKIARPVYIREMLSAILKHTKEGKCENIEIWLELCAWILSHSQMSGGVGSPSPDESSSDYPDWKGARRLVVDFIDVCVSGVAPIEAREGIATLLEAIIIQPDPHLDNRKAVEGVPRDLIFEAVNNTRSRAIESLHHFGFWIKRKNSNDPLPEVEKILFQRTVDDALFPLTPPEHAILGMLFVDFCKLSPNWAEQSRHIIFPQDNLGAWKGSFCSYLRYNNASKLGFELLRDNFEFALKNITTLVDEKEKSRELIDRFGQFLFIYYLQGEYPLRGKESLLERYYSSTADAKQHWAGLFEFAGRSIGDADTGKENDEESQKFKDFFDWRFSEGNRDEMTRFTFWLRGTAIDANWRLEAYSKILDISGMSDSGTSIELDALHKILPDHLDLVMECIMKKTKIIRGASRAYVSKERILPIIRAGLAATDLKIRKHADQAAENLLASGAITTDDLQDDEAAPI